MPYKDPEKQRAYFAARHRKNREKKKAYDAEYRAKHTEKKRQKDREYYQQNREDIIESSQQYYAENKEKIAQQAVVYRTRNRAKLLAQKATYYAANKETMLAHMRATYPTRAVAVRKRVKSWRAEHPDEYRAQQTAQRARKRGGTSDLSGAQRRELLEACGYRCQYCHQKFPAKLLTIDHITALSRGGDDTLHNVTVACGSCNSKKHTNSPPVSVQPFLLTVAPKKKRKVKT